MSQVKNIKIQSTNSKELKIPKLTFTAVASEAFTTSYREELSERLRSLLRLPEHGDVEVKMTVESTGKIRQFSILKSLSDLNRSYIEKHLQGLQLPRFGKEFGNAREHVFLITLSSE
jgi:hypothetical protein